MKYFFNIFIFTLLLVNCNSKKANKGITDENKSDRKFSLDYAVKAFTEIHPENDSIIKTFKNCISKGKLNDYNYYWEASDTLILKYPYDDLFLSIEDYYPAYKPTILSIQKKQKNKYLIKIAIMGNPENFNSLAIIYNFYAIRDKNGNFKFKNTITDNLKQWKRKTIENIEYIYPKDKEINLIEVKKQLDFENKLIDKFGLEKINYKYISANSVYDFMKIRGFDYENSMFFNNQKGGVSLPSHHLIFSGNNSEYYPHELVHLYTYKYFKNKNTTIDEGLATYLGGSKGFDYLYHINALKKYLTKNNIDLSEYLFDESKKHTLIADASSIQYTVGALLCSLADKQNSLIQLLNSGKSDDDLKKAISKIFNINNNEIDSFLKRELEKY